MENPPCGAQDEMRLAPFFGILPQSGARGKGRRGKLKEERGKWGIFEGAGVNGERAVGDAGPHGEVTSSAVSGPMWASAPTERLPIEFRRGRRPRRPENGRRRGPPCLDGQHKRGARRGG